MPYLTGTAQETLCRWLDEGLNAFSHTCSVGYQLFTDFSSQLADALCQPDQLQTLIEETRVCRDRLLEESEIGRDRLLERHSHDAVKGEALIQSLIAREQSDLLYSFSELLFDRIGLEQEYLDEHLYLVRPTENLATGQLPGLDEDGITATYHRQTALSRDEVTFLTWEHPIISETMAALLGSDIGKASLGTFKHRGVPAGTILLESLYRGVSGPAYLETGQFLDQRPLRMLLTQSGKEVGDKLSSHSLLTRFKACPVPPVPLRFTNCAPSSKRYCPLWKAAQNQKSSSDATRHSIKQRSTTQRKWGGSRIYRPSIHPLEMRSSPNCKLQARAASGR